MPDQFSVEKLAPGAYILSAPDGTPWERGKQQKRLKDRADLCNRVLDYMREKGEVESQTIAVTEGPLECANCAHMIEYPRPEDYNSYCSVCHIGRMQSVTS